jgi:type II secretory pathway pseudopilin PulG
MLVVIAIIGILAGILLPVLANAKKKTRITQARNDMSSIILAVSQYEADYNRYPATKAIEMLGGDYTYTNNNHVVFAILLNEDFGANAGFARNPKRARMLNAKMVSDGNPSGVGTGDRVYRDPWGTPYAVSVDLDGDNRCFDAFYSTRADGDAVGLRPNTPPNPPWFFNGDVMAWSFGPDQQIEDGNAKAGLNKDNVLSWAQ